MLAIPLYILNFFRARVMHKSCLFIIITVHCTGKLSEDALQTLRGIHPSSLTRSCICALFFGIRRNQFIFGCLCYVVWCVSRFGFHFFNLTSLEVVQIHNFLQTTFSDFLIQCRKVDLILCPVLWCFFLNFR